MTIFHYQAYNTHGCDIQRILAIYREDQCEHLCSAFGDMYLKYRKTVFEWMLDVCRYFNMDPITTHGAMAYLDRLQPNEMYSRFEWQMLAICCILISAKFNESELDVPDLTTLEEITLQVCSYSLRFHIQLSCTHYLTSRILSPRKSQTRQCSTMVCLLAISCFANFMLDDSLSCQNFGRCKEWAGN
jgi:Cyclin, N-terminal domain